MASRLGGQRMTDDAKTMLIREFEFALRLAWLEETERMRATCSTVLSCCATGWPI